jgi:hypothetical protein
MTEEVTHGPNGQADPPHHGGADPRADQGDSGVPPGAACHPITVTFEGANKGTGDHTILVNNQERIREVEEILATMERTKTEKSILHSTGHFMTATTACVGTFIIGSGGFGPIAGGLRQPSIQSLASIPVPHEGIIAGEIIAWRGWGILHNPLRLVSLTMHDTEWEPDTPMTGVVEDSGHGYSGVHAWKTFAQARNYTKSYSQLAVIGRVALWGTVTEHEEGYRAENARIMSLDETINLKQSRRDHRIWLWRRPSLLDQLRKKYKLKSDGDRHANTSAN